MNVIICMTYFYIYMILVFGWTLSTQMRCQINSVITLDVAYRRWCIEYCTGSHENCYRTDHPWNTLSVIEKSNVAVVAVQIVIRLGLQQTPDWRPNRFPKWIIKLKSKVAALVDLSLKRDISMKYPSSSIDISLVSHVQNMILLMFTMYIRVEKTIKPIHVCWNYCWISVGTAWCLIQLRCSLHNTERNMPTIHTNIEHGTKYGLSWCTNQISFVCHTQ